MAALEEYFQLGGHTAKICCDNQGALFKSSELRRRIPTGASQADIKRVLRNVKHKIKPPSHMNGSNLTKTGTNFGTNSR
jgi:hypothetical protein